MDDDVQQLLNLGLKMMGFGLAHKFNISSNYKMRDVLINKTGACVKRLDAINLAK
jgi:hypothetical protein